MNDLIYFEKKNLNRNADSSKTIEKYYADCKQADFIKFIDDSFPVLQNSYNNDIFFKKTINNIIFSYFKNTHDFDDCVKIKNNHDLLILYITFFIAKNLWLYRAGTNDVVYHLSDSLSNEIQSDIENLLKYIQAFCSLKVKFPTNVRKLVQFALKKLLFAKKISDLNKKVNEKTIKFYYTKQESHIKPCPRIHRSKFSYFEYKEEDLKFIWSEHHSSVYDVFKKNKRSGFIFETRDTKSIEKACEEFYYLDIVFLKTLFNKWLDHLTIKEEDIESRFDRLINQLKISIKNKNILDITSTSQVLSEYAELLVIKKIIDENENNIEIYLPFFYDFRSRYYYLSDLSPTFFKIFRYSIHFGKYEDLRSENHVFLLNVNNEIDKRFHHLERIEGLELAEKPIEIKRAVVWFLVWIGEIHKTSFKNQKSNGISLDDFIEKAVGVVNEHLKVGYLLKDLDDHIKFNYIILVLKEMSEGIYYKRLISKDATASCFQHLVKILGSASEESLKWCNLSSKNRWYDTYIYILENFKKDIKVAHLTEEEFDEIFSRKLKNVMMTHSYSAKRKTCLKYFREKINLPSYSCEKQSEIITLFDDFYIFLNKNSAILKESPDKLVNYFDKNKKVNFNDGSSVDLTYYQWIKIQKEFKSDKIRYTYTNKVLSKKEDSRKFKLSVKANYVHSLDGYLAFWIRKECKVITIHDCFLIDYAQTSYLIAKLNEGMHLFFHDIELDSRINTDELFSLFIII